ncbi:MAG TPA: hypothetical protein VF373_03875, partial [Prolixibacteraceae bacterium]
MRNILPSKKIVLFLIVLHLSRKFQKAVLLVAILLLVSVKSWSVTYYSWGNAAPNLTTSWWANNNGTGAQ